MTDRSLTKLTAGAFLMMLGSAAPSYALTAQECSAKYQAAKTAGTLDGQSWNDFRRAQCAEVSTPAASDDKAAATEPKASEIKSTETKASEIKPAEPKAADTKPAARPKAAAAPATPAGPATYPTAVDPKFAKEPATRARLHTCAEQWKANKAANTTGGLKWIQKGGGYWSECNKRLKG
ncbi:hypothetical protein [Rhodopseudomonas palustris]|uniref:Uncharacterized protein n=1 Tax=Rhodopseudomonas palustris TaxID=1076 RepID=A0A418VID9_RHOPL|nr:hypothetical protein [Rhodopseudomonas palustris]RJF75796.1 hypothetical protein D4Q52_08560 [Rhodopseudomonas palustris]